jgi:hypothetical protein
MDLLVKRAARRLTWLLQTTPVNVIEPAVVDAPEPPILDSAIGKIRSSMRAVEPEQARTLRVIPKEYEFLTQ